MLILMTIFLLYMRTNALPIGIDLDDAMGEIVMNWVETDEKVEALVEMFQKMYSEQQNELEPNIWTKFDQLNAAVHEKQNYQRKILQLFGELKNLLTMNHIKTFNGDETSQINVTYGLTNDSSEIMEKKKESESERNKWRREYWKKMVEKARNQKKGVSEQVHIVAQNYYQKDVSENALNGTERGQNKINGNDQSQVENNEMHQNKIKYCQTNSKFEPNNLCETNDQQMEVESDEMERDKLAKNDQNELMETLTSYQNKDPYDTRENNLKADQNNDQNSLAEKDQTKVVGNEEIKIQKNARKCQNKKKNKQLAADQQHLTPMKILKRGETLDNYNCEVLEKGKNKVEDVETVEKRDVLPEIIIMKAGISEQNLTQQVSETSDAKVAKGNKNYANRNKYNVIGNKTRLEPISEMEEESISEIDVVEQPMLANSSIPENVAECPMLTKPSISENDIKRPILGNLNISTNLEEQSMLLNQSTSENVSESDNVVELPVISKQISSKLNPNATPYIFGIKNAMEN